MANNKKKKPLISPKYKLFLIVFLIPITLTVYFFAYFSWQQIRKSAIFERFSERSVYEQIQEQFDLAIPIEYIPVYVAAEEKYGVPGRFLPHIIALKHVFPQCELMSPVGAEGHMQFMPCTFVGWKHPSCKGLAKGKLRKREKTNPAMIKKYGGYGVDANGDGIADPFDIEDAVYSVQLTFYPMRCAKGELKKAIFQYNHSDEYVQDILHYYKRTVITMIN